jgi:hypothetical protein
MGDNDDRRFRFEFAILMALVLFALWQIGVFAWRSLGGLF